MSDLWHEFQEHPCAWHSNVYSGLSKFFPCVKVLVQCDQKTFDYIKLSLWPATVMLAAPLLARNISAAFLITASCFINILERSLHICKVLALSVLYIWQPFNPFIKLLEKLYWESSRTLSLRTWQEVRMDQRSLFTRQMQILKWIFPTEHPSWRVSSSYILQNYWRYLGSILIHSGFYHILLGHHEHDWENLQLGDLDSNGGDLLSSIPFSLPCVPTIKYLFEFDLENLKGTGWKEDEIDSFYEERQGLSSQLKNRTGMYSSCPALNHSLPLSTFHLHPSLHIIIYFSTSSLFRSCVEPLGLCP